MSVSVGDDLHTVEPHWPLCPHVRANNRDYRGTESLWDLQSACSMVGATHAQQRHHRRRRPSTVAQAVLLAAAAANDSQPLAQEVVQQQLGARGVAEHASLEGPQPRQLLPAAPPPFLLLHARRGGRRGMGGQQ